MRIAVICLVAVATPALAQDYLGLALARDAERVADQQAARLRDIAITNELSRLQAQAQTTQALSDLAAARARPTLPVVPLDPKAPPPTIDVSKLAAIPDAALADSNAKVRAAAENPR